MKVYKPYTDEEYADLAVYCNDNNYLIEDKGDYLESVPYPNPTQEEKEQEVRAVRNSYLEDFVDPYQLVIRWEKLSETEKEYKKEYRQYLLDYTNEENWYDQNPDTYEEWLLVHHPVVKE